MNEVLRVLSAALRLDPALFRAIDESPLTLLPALGVALIAAASTMVGQMAVLLINHIKGWRLATSLILGAVLLAALHVIQMVVTWTLASLVLQRPLPLLPLLVVGLLSLAPLTFNIVVAFPHLGMGFGRAIEAWSYLVMVVGISTAFRLPFWWAFGFTLAGWVVMQLLSRLLHRPVNWAFSRLWTLATGRPTMLTARDILTGSPIIPVTQKFEVER